MVSLASKINAIADRENVDSRRFVEEQRIKRALAPAQWDALRKALEAECRRLSEGTPVQLNFEEEPSGKITTTNLSTGKVALLYFDPEVPCIHFQTAEISGHIGFHVSRDGTMLQFVESGLPRFIEQLKHRILAPIVGR